MGDLTHLIVSKTMKPKFQVPISHVCEVVLRRDMEETSRPTRKPIRSVLERLNDFVERSMKNLCKHGEPVREDEPVAREYTLQRNFHLIEKGEYHRWQWDVEKHLPTCRAPKEVYRCEMFAT